MKITVLGKSPAWQDSGGACSGYLIEEAGTTVLLDCGNGVFGKLRARCDYTDVDAVVISHMHADHFIDLIPYSYALLLTPRQQPVPVAGHPGTQEPARPRLVAPPGAKQMFRNVVGSWGDGELVEQAFELEELRSSDGGRDRPARLSLRRGAALHPHARGRGLVKRRAGSPSAPIAGPVRSWSSSPARRTCCSSRRPCRVPSGPGSAAT